MIVNNEKKLCFKIMLHVLLIIM